MEHGTIQLLNCMLKTSHVPVGQNSNMQGHNMTTHGLLKKGGFQQVPSKEAIGGDIGLYWGYIGLRVWGSGFPEMSSNFWGYL